MKCLNCKSELKECGGTGFLDGVDKYCPKCGVMYKNEEPIAVQKGDNIIML